MGVNGIYGLSGSGLDIESMVKVGMLSKQNEYDRMYKKEVKNEWLKEGYNEIYTSLNTFKYSTLSDYKMQSNMNAMKAESSNSSTVSVTANGAAVAMTHNVQVNSLSSNAYLLTTDAGITRENEDAASSIYLKDNVFKSIEAADDDTEGNKQYKITLANGDERTVKATDKAISFMVTDGKNGVETMTDAEKGKQTISYTFEDLFNGKTYNDLAADIRNTGTNVTASYDATNDSFSIYNSESGSDAKISLAMGSPYGFEAGAGGEFAAKLFNNMNLGQSQDGTLGDPQAFTAGSATTVAGKEGSVTIDGRTYNDVKDNRITVSGVTYTLLNVSEKDASGAAKNTTVSVSQDTEAIIGYVKKFVEDYNKVLDDLTEKYNEVPKADYEPLSKSQEASMTQEQIDKWTEKAKTGLFYHSEVIGKIITAMREAVSTPVQGVNSSYNCAAAIGITTETGKTTGHLTLDTDKLKKALAADPDCVYQIFASDQDTYTEAAEGSRNNFMLKDDYNNRGIANRLYFNSMSDGITAIQDYAGFTGDADDQSTLGKLISGLKDKMDSFKAMMDDYQTQLYKKYDALESMIASMNAQYNTLFGGMNG